MEENNEQLIPASVHVDEMYKSWFMDYASYVILERAVPALEDGLKPVQRRILHAMKEMDDGRYNKVANIIGQTMQYHPHGDASIGEAMINLGQKDLLIDTQGNWGDNRTGDSAAAPRYIEARLSKFALDVAYNAKTTNWQLSYDGRKNEPIALPMKFPLLLAQGVEGIAVGLSTKILPHNFCELLEAAIKHLKGKKFELYPDFGTGGMIDVGNYNDGLRGGKVRVRVRIEELDKKSLLIKDVPYGVTTSQLVDSILKANDNGKIKIKSVVDNTAQHVELLVQLHQGVSTDQAIDALYAFTDCEISISPNACVIVDDKPKFLGVTELLKQSVAHTQALLLKELEIKLGELQDSWHYSSLEKIFIEKRIYRDIEEQTTWEGVLTAIEKGLSPYIKHLKREVTRDDIVKLTEIRIKRISKYDAFKADELINGIENEMEEVQHNMNYLTEFTISYYENLLKKYGKERCRKTEIRPFETIQIAQVAIANTKLYVNRKEGFIGTVLKKDEFAFDCSDLDQIIVFKKDGKMVVTKVSDKTFVGKDIIHLDVFRKSDERMTYNMIYVDGKTGIAYGKRFNVSGITRDKEYDLTKGNANSKVLYFTANANGEAEIISILLSPGSKARNKLFDFLFENLEIKGRGAGGNQVTKYPIKTVKLKEKGRSTLSGQKIWYDASIGRLNKEGNGKLLGSFEEGETILTIYNNGVYELTDFDLLNRYEADNLLLIEKFNQDKIIAAIYYDAKTNQHYAKRFLIESKTLKSQYQFIKEGDGNVLKYVTTDSSPIVIVKSGKKKSELVEEEIDLAETIDVSGWKTIGTKFGTADIKEILPLPDNGDEQEDLAAPTLF
jgi:topoisomerase-4 subunit A